MDQSIMRFATTTARDAAFGGAGEPVLAEGMFAYVDADDTLYYYTGSAWTEYNKSGLTLVKAQTIGSAVSTVTVSDVFSSTYDNYKVVISGGSSSGSLDLRLTLGATTSDYYYAQYYIVFSTGNGNDISGDNVAYIPVGGANTTSVNSSFEILSPNLAENTMVYSSAFLSSQGGAGWVNGYLANTTAYTAFTLTTSTGTLTGGTIRVYGYRN